MRSKKYCILTAVILLLTSISAFASEIEYTTLYVGSNKAFVNDIQKQIDAENNYVITPPIRPLEPVLPVDK